MERKKLFCEIDYSGLVGIGAFLRLVNHQLGGDSIGAAAVVLLLLINLLSPFLLVVTIFHHKLEPKILENLRDSGIAENAGVTLTQRS